MRALLINVGHGGDASDAHPRHHVAPIDLGICASILERAGYRVDLWDTFVTPEAQPDEVADRVRLKRPDLLLLRPLHGHEESTRKILDACDAGSARYILGPSAPQVADALLDAGCLEGALIGEPELTLQALVRALKANKPLEGIAGLKTGNGNGFKPRGFNLDLDALPLPAHHLLMNQGYQFRYPLDVKTKLNIGYVLSSRGCALGCLFCAPVERETVGTKYRWRSAANVVDEIELLRSLGANALYFIDDFFGFSNRRIRELCEEMIARNVILPWAAQVRAQGIDLELLKLMRRAGCSTLCFGAESGSDRVLKVLRKGVRTDQIREQAALIREANIQSVGYFIVGVPGETDAERQSTYALIDEIQPDVVQIHIFNVFPDAPAMEVFPDRYVVGATKFTGPEGYDAALEALQTERRSFYRSYYFSRRYLQRALPRRWRAMLANLDEEVDFVKRATRFFLGRA